MAHRALVARRRPDGGYAVHEASRGAHELALLGALAPGRDGSERADASTTEWPSAPDPVDASPVAVVDGFDAVVREHVDPLSHEAVFRMTRRAVRPSLPVHLWVGGDTEPAAGLLVGLDPQAPRRDWRRVRAAVRGMRAALARMVDHGHAGHAEVARVLAACVRSEAADRPVRPIPAPDGTTL